MINVNKAKQYKKRKIMKTEIPRILQQQPQVESHTSTAEYQTRRRGSDIRNNPFQATEVLTVQLLSEILEELKKLTRGK